MRFIIKGGYSQFKYINKETWTKNPRFIIKSGFKSRAGYDGARTVVGLVGLLQERYNTFSTKVLVTPVIKMLKICSFAQFLLYLDSC